MRNRERKKKNRELVVGRGSRRKRLVQLAVVIRYTQLPACQVALVHTAMLHTSIHSSEQILLVLVPFKSVNRLSQPQCHQKITKVLYMNTATQLNEENPVWSQKSGLVSLSFPLTVASARQRSTWRQCPCSGENYLLWGLDIQISITSSMWIIVSWKKRHKETPDLSL